MNDVEALERAERLERMGLIVRSPVLAAMAESTRAFYERGGNRAMRRQAARAARRRRR